MNVLETPICVDGRLLQEEGTGVATYARGLCAALAMIGEPPLVMTDSYRGLTQPARSRPRAERWRRWLFTRTDRALRVERVGSELIARDVFRRAQRHFRDHGTLMRVRVAGPPGLMHWSYPLPLRIEGWHNIYTVHDAIPLTHPALSPIDPDRHRRLLAAVGKAAAAVLTVSDDAAAALTASGVLGDASVVNCGVAVPPPNPSGPLPNQLKPDGYFLVCGAVEPRKNLAVLVSAWRASGTALPLVVAGPDGWRADHLSPLLAGSNIHRLPYLPRDALAAVQASARALLFPSLAEGFGLPVIEAMALGTPVMTSSGGSTEEVSGRAALLIDPRDVASMAAAIARLDGDAGLRVRLAEAGRARAIEFSVARFAARLAAVHNGLIANGNVPIYSGGVQ